jgi:hypothetical protein
MWASGIYGYTIWTGVKSWSSAATVNRDRLSSLPGAALTAFPVNGTW